MFYVIVSAVCFIVPYFFPALSLLLFISLLPLMYQLYQSQLTYRQGLVWGVIVYALHLLWFLFLLLSRGIGLLRVGLYIVTVAWLVLWTGVWFWLTGVMYYILRYKFFTKIHSGRAVSLRVIAFIVSWLISTLIYFYFVLNFSMLPAGVIEGYTFINPLIPLAHYPQLIWCTSWLGPWGALSYLLLFQVCLVLGYVKHIRYFLYAVLCLMPFLSGFVLYAPIQVGAPQFCFVKPWWNLDRRYKDPMFVGYRMVYDVTQAVYNNLEKQAVIMPESTFGWNLYEYQQFVPMICECAEGVPILFGAQRNINGKLYNTCFVIQDGVIVWEYDKIHLMPLVERLPQLLPLEIFTLKDDVFEYGSSNQSDVVELCGQRYQIFICSELFCESKSIKGLPILFLYNDEWLHCNYMKRLAKLYIQYIALKYQVSIVSSGM